MASQEKSIVLCDRGLMDAGAYMNDQGWQDLLRQTDWEETELRDGRYDRVLHLVTAAIGAEAFYTGANNAARLETAEEAAWLDGEIANMWVGHQHVSVIDNSTGFEDKIDRAVQAICKHVGVASPTGHRRHFLIRRENVAGLRAMNEEKDFLLGI